MKNHFGFWAMFVAVHGLLGCAHEVENSEADSSGLSLGGMVENRSGLAAAKSALRLKAARLGPDERRVMVFVLPGDASVEVDGRPAFRRNGVIELVGKVGDVRKLRVFKGPRSTEEKTITIGEAGATPALVDLNEVVLVAAGTTTKKAKPLVFGDIDE